MAVISTLQIGLVFATSQFESGLNKALGSLKQFTSGIGGLNSAMGAIGLGVGVFAIKRVVDRLDELNDSAGRLGVSVDALSRLRYVSEQLTHDSSSLDNAIAKLAINLGKAAIEAKGPTYDALSRLGLSLGKLSTMNIDESFIAIAKAIGDVRNPLEQAALATEIFGKGGAQVLGVLRAGGDQLDRWAARADVVGAVITPEEASVADDLNNQINDLTKSIEKLSATFLRDFGPSLVSAVNGLTNFVSTSRTALDMAQALGRALAANVSGWGGGITPEELANPALLGVRLAKDAKDERDVMALGRPARGIPGIDPDKADEAEQAAKKLEDANKKLVEAAVRVFEETRTPQEQFAQRMDDLQDLLRAGAIDWETYGRASTKANEELAQSLERLDAPIRKAEEEMRRAQEEIEKVEAEARAFEKQEALRFTEAALTKGERARVDASFLKDAFDRGDISKKVFERNLASLEAGLKQNEPSQRFGSAINVGSQADRAAILNLRAGQGNEQKEIAENTREEVETSREALEELRSMRRALEMVPSEVDI